MDKFDVCHCLKLVPRFNGIGGRHSIGQRLGCSRDSAQMTYGDVMGDLVEPHAKRPR